MHIPLDIDIVNKYKYRMCIKSDFMRHYLGICLWMCVSTTCVLFWLLFLSLFALASVERPIQKGYFHWRPRPMSTRAIITHTIHHTQSCLHHALRTDNMQMIKWPITELLHVCIIGWGLPFRAYTDIKPLYIHTFSVYLSKCVQVCVSVSAYTGRDKEYQTPILYYISNKCKCIPTNQWRKQKRFQLQTKTKRMKWNLDYAFGHVSLSFCSYPAMCVKSKEMIQQRVGMRCKKRIKRWSCVLNEIAAPSPHTHRVCSAKGSWVMNWAKKKKNERQMARDVREKKARSTKWGERRNTHQVDNKSDTKLINAVYQASFMPCLPRHPAHTLI